MPVTGGEALVDALISLGVDTGFTVPGESFLSVLEALRVKRDAFHLVSTRHESGAAFAANAYARLTGRPAAVFVSRGPGATNAAIGIHTARQGSVPMLLFIGHVRTRSKGREAFQEIDHHAMFAPVAKAVMEPRETSYITRVTAEAIAHALAERPGPVVVVLPRDITEAWFDGSRTVTPKRAGDATPPASKLSAAEQAIAKARYPLIVAGEMVSFEAAESALAGFADGLGAPVMTAYRQQDTFPNEHPAYAGHLEINRPVFQREAFARSDLILAIGTRLDGITTEDYTLMRADQTLVQVYPDDEVLERTRADVSIRSDIVSALSALSADPGTHAEERLAWRDALHAAYLHLSTPTHGGARGAVDLAVIVSEVSKSCGDEAIIVTDGGSFARWVHRYHRFSKPRSLAGPVSGAMGYAVPGTIGASLACPGAPVLGYVGDGGFMMTGQELMTAAQENLNVKILVCDNRAQGSILYAQCQRFGASSDYATRIESPDFASVARAYGVPGWRIEATSDFADAFRAALDHQGPALIHLLTDQRDIVPSGPEDDVV